MIARSNEFKQEIVKLGKQIDFIINLYTNDKIITEDSEFLMTQDNLNLVVEQFSLDDTDMTIYSEDIYNVSIIRKGELLSTMMKSVELELKQDLRVGDVLDCNFGLKVGNEYEYLNYGKFIIYSKEHNEDTDTYSYVAYDTMLLSMVEVDDTSIIQGVSVKQAIENICEKVGLNVNITSQDIQNLPNLENIINEEAFNDIDMTYRDVLDMICQCLGVSMICDNRTLYLKTLNNTIVDEFNEEFLKDVNVKFGDKYMINSVVLSRSEDNDTIYRRDETSIELNGVHEFKIKDNLIMNFNDREDYIDEIFEQLNGLEFYLNDFSSTGITYLELLDFYNINIDNNIYKCLMLNDEIKIQQGLEETIYTEMPEETTTDYKTSSKTDKEVSFIVDKQNGKINAKVSKGDIINEINLDQSGASINAEKISLAGKTIEMTSDNIKINSSNFSVDNNGNMSCNNAILSGTFENYDRNNNLAIRISDTNINLYDYEGTGALSGSLSSVRGISDRVVGINLYTYLGNKIVLGYKNSEFDTTVNTIFEFDTNNLSSTPWVKNTASGTLFPSNPNGGIEVENGFIKSWNLKGASATIVRDSTRYEFVNGLLVSID